MSNIAAPKTRILSGAGILYRAPIGIPLPGQIPPVTVTQKALTSNVATLTVNNTLTVGDKVVVTGVGAPFDGTFTTTAVTSTTVSYAVMSANITAVAAMGSLTTPGGGVVVGSRFVDAFPSAWVPIGITKEGHEWTYKIDTDEVEAAEYLLPVLTIPKKGECKVSVEIMETTAANLAWSLNGGQVLDISGTGATKLTRVGPAPIGQEVRTQLGWQSDDCTERGFFYQCLQTGELKMKHDKGSNVAMLTTDWAVEQPATGEPFNRFYAGTSVLGTF